MYQCDYIIIIDTFIHAHSKESITFIIELCKVEKSGITGTILGRSIYEGTIDLKEAIDVGKEDSHQEVGTDRTVDLFLRNPGAVDDVLENPPNEKGQEKHPEDRRDEVHGGCVRGGGVEDSTGDGRDAERQADDQVGGSSSDLEESEDQKAGGQVTVDLWGVGQYAEDRAVKLAGLNVNEVDSDSAVVFFSTDLCAGSAFYLDGELVINEWGDPENEITEAKFTNSSSSVDFEMEEGSAHDIILEFHKKHNKNLVRLEWELPGQESSVKEAVELAKKSDVARIFRPDIISPCVNFCG